MSKFFKVKNNNKKDIIDDISKYEGHFDNEKSEIERLKDIKTINPFKKVQIRQDIKKIEKDIKQKKKEIDKRIREEKQRKERKLAYIGMIVMFVVSFGGLGIMSYRSKINKIKFITYEDVIYIGDTLDLQYQVRPTSAEYESDEISIVIDNSELIEQKSNNYIATKEGNVKASIVYNDNTYDQKTISILPIEVKSISAQDIDLGINLETNADIKFYPEDSTHKEILLSSSDSNIAKIADDKIIGVSEGKVRITAKSVDGPETTFNVNVSYVEPQSIEIGGLIRKYTTGTERDLTVFYTPKNISNMSPEIHWSSSNNGIVSVDENGHINCKQRGSAIITAYYSDTVFASETINVVYPDPTKITLSGNSDELYKGYTTRLYASFEPELVEDKTIEWSSSDENKATVNEYGTVTGVSYGEVFITAKTINGLTDRYKLLITEAPTVSYYNSGESGSGGGQSQGRINTGSGEVYISDTSTRFHTNPTCHGMKDAWLVTVDYAKSIGLPPCGTCAKGY